MEIENRTTEKIGSEALYYNMEIFLISGPDIFVPFDKDAPYDNLAELQDFADYIEAAALTDFITIKDGLGVQLISRHNIRFLKGTACYQVNKERDQRGY